METFLNHARAQRATLQQPRTLSLIEYYYVDIEKNKGSKISIFSLLLSKYFKNEQPRS